MRAPLTPIKAFVHDVEQLGVTGAPSADDPRLSHWLAVAQAAERLSLLAPTHRGDYLRALAERVLPARSGRPTQIEGDGRAPVNVVEELAERLRLEAEDMERAGCFELALVTVSSVCHMLAHGSESSRLLATAHMGRVNRQLGELDSAVECYQTVTDDGLVLNDGPVAAHGFIGLGNVAYARGNRPAHKLFFEQALKLAARNSPVELSAHQGLMVAANALRQWADALLHGWRAHDLAPPGSEVQLEIIGNLSVTALEAGFPVAAINGHEYVLQHTSVTRVRLPSVIGLARSAARAGNASLLSRMEHVGRETFNAAEPLDVARFLLCMAESWHTLHEYESARRWVGQASELAGRFGFHEITIRAEELLTTNAAASALESDVSHEPHYDDRVLKGISRLESLAIA